MLGSFRPLGLTPMRFPNLWSWVTCGPTRAAAHRSKKCRSGSRFAPVLNRLEGRDVPNGYIAAGAGAGAPPLVAIRVDKINDLNQGGLGNVPGAGGILNPTSDG